MGEYVPGEGGKALTQQGILPVMMLKVTTPLAEIGLSMM